VRWPFLAHHPSRDAIAGLAQLDGFRQYSPDQKVFNDAMTSFSAAVIPAALEAYSFEGIDTLVDVAGGHGDDARPSLRRES